VSIIKRLIKYILGKLGFEITRIKKQEVETIQKVFGEFVDSRLNRFQLVEGYRKKMWPSDWQATLESMKTPNEETVMCLNLMAFGRGQVMCLENFLNTRDLTIAGKVILEVGCAFGNASYALAEREAILVDAIDCPEAWVISLHPSREEIDEKSEYFRVFRESMGHVFERETAKPLNKIVHFRDLDAASLDAQDVYDLIVSFDTFEHIMDPAKALKAMFMALKPGGFCVHQYHPFFSENGAHFDTLDFRWGHVRLASEDFDRYKVQYHSDEMDLVKIRFYRSINRMTISDFKEHTVMSGFEIVELVVTGGGIGTLENIDFKAFKQGRANYPSLTISDLYGNRIWVLLKKPLQ
jgi:SAM-dependent methyltransferase